MNAHSSKSVIIQKTYKYGMDAMTVGPVVITERKVAHKTEPPGVNRAEADDVSHITCLGQFRMMNILSLAFEHGLHLCLEIGKQFALTDRQATDTQTVAINETRKCVDWLTIQQTPEILRRDSRHQIIDE